MLSWYHIVITTIEQQTWMWFELCLLCIQESVSCNQHIKVITIGMWIYLLCFFQKFLTVGFARDDLIEIDQFLKHCTAMSRLKSLVDHVDLDEVMSVFKECSQSLCIFFKWFNVSRAGFSCLKFSLLYRIQLKQFTQISQSVWYHHIPCTTSYEFPPKFRWKFTLYWSHPRIVREVCSWWGHPLHPNGI